MKNKGARISQVLSSDPCRADSRYRWIFKYSRQSKVTRKFEETSLSQRHQELGTGKRWGCNSDEIRTASKYRAFLFVAVL